MTAKIKGRVKGAFDAAETETPINLNKVQDSRTVLSKEVWEIPDKKIKGESFPEGRTDISKKKNIFSKEGELFLAERSITPKEKSSLQMERREKTQKERNTLDLNNVQKPTSADYSAKAERETDGDEEDNNKEIAFFTEPKSVKRKTQRHIFAFQAISAAAVCLIMLLLKLFAPELYDNLHLYYFRMFQW